MYCPFEVMVPGPLFPSPPLTDQVTGAAPPPLSFALNCSTDEPFELVALQPVQFVSMISAPGEMEKLELVESAVTGPAVQPASTSKAGVASKASFFNDRTRARACATRGPLGVAQENGPFLVDWAIRSNVLVLSRALNR